MNLLRFGSCTKIKKECIPFFCRPGFFFLVYLALAAFSLRYLLITPGTLGHNWDAPIPADAGTLRYVAEHFAYSTWYTQSLGMPKGMMLVTMWNMVVYSLPAYFGFSGDAASKLIYLLILATSAVGMCLYLFELLSSRDNFRKSDSIDGVSAFGPFLGGLLYGFSPFLFNDLQGGALTQTVSYACVPFAFYFTHQLVFNLRWRFSKCLGLSIVMALMAASAHYSLLFGLLLAVYGVVALGIKHAGRRLLPSVVLATLFSAPWLLPLLGELNTLGQTLPSTENTGDYLASLRLGPSLLDVATLTGYFNRPFYLWAIPVHWFSVWISAVLGILAFSIYQIRRPQNLLSPLRLSLFWIFLLLISLPLAAVGDKAVGWLSYWLYSNVSAMINFRSYQRLMVLPTIAMAVVIALAISNWRRRLTQRNIFLELILFFAVITWTGVFWTGDLGLARLKGMGAGNHLDQYQLGPSYEQSLKYIERDPEMFRVLTLPMVVSPLYLPTEYQSYAQGGDPTVIFAPRPGLHLFPGVHSSLQPLLYGLQDFGNEKVDVEIFFKILRTFNVKYILLRRDVVPVDENLRLNWNPRAADAFLRTSPSLVARVDGVEATLFEVLGERQYQLNVVPLERTAYCNEATVDKIILQPEFGKKIEYCTSIRIENDSSVGARPLPMLSSMRFSDTRYLFSLHNWFSPVLITFQESFNRLWRICPVRDAEVVKRLRSDVGWRIIDDLFVDWSSNCVDVRRHVQVNGYSNGWLLDPTTLAMEFPAANGSTVPPESTWHFVVEYRSQRLLDWGLVIAVITLLLSFVILLINFYRGNHRIN